MNTKTINWSSQLKTTFNTNTKETRYFMLICDVWVRVAKKSYDTRESEANNSSCYQTKRVKHLVHQYKTVSGGYQNGT